METTTVEYEVGDTIEYRPSAGTLRIVTVIEQVDDIEGTNQPGFDARMLEQDPAQYGRRVWGYDHQVTRIVTKGQRLRQTVNGEVQRDLSYTEALSLSQPLYGIPDDMWVVGMVALTMETTKAITEWRWVEAPPAS